MRLPIPHRLRDRRRSRGQSIVEFALVVPLLLLIFAGAADLGRLFFNYVALENAVKEGALYGARSPICDDASAICPDPNNVVWRVENEARTAAGTALVTPASECRNAVTGAAYADLRDCVAGDTYVVSATLAFNLITPIVGQIMGGTIDLGAEARAVVLNQAFDPTPGLAPTKLVLASGARNAIEIAANCVQPDPVGSTGYYRSPCIDEVAPIDPLNPLISAVFRPGDPINYKIVVINNGGTNVTGVTITDTFTWPAVSIPNCPARPTSMNVGSSYSCSYARTAPAVSGTGDTSTYTNTVTANGTEILATIDKADVTLERPPAHLVALKFVNVYKLGGNGDGPLFGTSNAISIWRNTPVPSPSVWYKLSVQNTGGRTATDLSITDSFGPLPTNADCPARPTSLAAGASWICLYQRSFNATGSNDNTITATATNVTSHPDATYTATVTVQACAAPSMVVPNLIGLVKATAVSTWNPGSGFTTALGTWSGNNGATVATQSQRAFTCMPAATAMTVTR